MNKATTIQIDGGPITRADALAVARHHAPVAITDAALQRIAASRSVVEQSLATSDVVYGVNTGFGNLSRRRIGANEIRQVQRNLIRSHAAGVGEPLPSDIVRCMLTILAASLARGHSGVRPIIVERIVDLLNHDITPVVPSRGSVGASGDLAPLSHCALLLIGEGWAIQAGMNKSGGQALADAGLEPVVLDAKEGLALINGTHLMAAMAALALADLRDLMGAAIAAAALTIDACKCTDAALDQRLHRARRQRGQEAVAARLRAHLDGSRIVPSHRDDDPRVQDPYSIRCTPQVLGSVCDTIEHAETIVDRELTGVTDNPLVFTDHGDAPAIVSGGNFHGQPLAMVMDMLAIATAHLAGISERRTYFLLAASDSENPVNPFLSPNPGLHSGLMITQYTAAACCNEIQTLAVPASVANIATSAGQEDFNSFGPTAGFQLQRAIELARAVVAIELLCSAEALEYQRPLRSGAGVERTHALIREVVPRLTEDRPPAPDIAAICGLIRQGCWSG